jgi:hypothetical protein
MVAVTVLATSLGCWLTAIRQKAQRENAAIAWVVENGGEINYDYRPNKSLWEKATVNLLGPKKAVRAYLHYQNVSDISPLAVLKDLKLIVLTSTPVSDVTPLANVKGLETLDLINTQVTPEQVENLGKTLPNCRINYSHEPLPLWAKLVEDWRISVNRKK